MAEVVSHSPQSGSPDLRFAHGTSSIVQVETLGKGVAAVLIGAALLSAGLAGAAFMEARSSQDALQRSEQAALAREAQLRQQFDAVHTESRMAEYYILELDGKLMASGFIPPSRGYGQWKRERKK